MGVQSKVATQASVTNLLRDLVMGNKNRKLVSVTVLLIIGFLLHVRSKKPEVDSLRNSSIEQN
jgi:hypothetical protein